LDTSKLVQASAEPTAVNNSNAIIANIWDIFRISSPFPFGMVDISLRYEIPPGGAIELASSRWAARRAVGIAQCILNWEKVMQKEKAGVSAPASFWLG